MARRRKSILKKNQVEIALRKRTCKNSGISILKNEGCLVVWDDQQKHGTYCRSVALLMIADARAALDLLEEELEE